MRIYLKLSSNQSLVPYNYQLNLVGTLHKWLGKNKEHDQLSLYSFSWLRGGKNVSGKGLTFNDGADWFISAHSQDLAKKLINSIISDPVIAFGLCVEAIDIRETPIFRSGTRFYLGSPVLIKRNFGSITKHFTYMENASDLYLTETLHHKLERAGLSTEGAEICFDRSHPTAKTKLSTYRQIQNKVNYCPIFLHGTPEQMGFAWDTGIGNSTGIGFGSLI